MFRSATETSTSRSAKIQILYEIFNILIIITIFAEHFFYI